MTRGEALAVVASGCLGVGALLEYVPGVHLVVDHPICGTSAMRPKCAPEHRFQAIAMEHPHTKQDAWGYYVHDSGS
jgi:hypothetical protein